MQKDVIAKGFVLLLAGIPIYVFVKWWEGRKATTVEDLLAKMPPQVEAPPEDAYRHGDELLPAGGAR